MSTLTNNCSGEITPEVYMVTMRAMRDALDFLGGKWKLPIMMALISGGRQRFRELERNVSGITPRMLSKELHDLEINHLITRQVLDTKPVSVAYDITEYSKSLRPVLEALATWGSNHRAVIMGKKEPV